MDATRARWRVEFESIDETETGPETGPEARADDAEGSWTWTEGWRAKGVETGAVESSSSLWSMDECDGAGEGKEVSPKDRCVELEGPVEAGVLDDDAEGERI